ncbi:MAG: hypothetical protein H6696_14760 [Deferribacteres bacterium]|nr:hypothetical protein [candidate division KSB1 bacterium]MCB9503189.1 hypothetical protein [Deferribacteres bacterium]
MIESLPDYATYRGMMDNFKKVYDGLELIISNTRKFSWYPSGEPEDEYSGPIKPTGIVYYYIVTSNLDKPEVLLDASFHALVLAENVPNEFTDPFSECSDVVLAPLDQNLNFKNYDESSKELTRLQIDRARDQEQTIEGLCRQENNFYKLVWNAKISMQDKLRWRDENP